MTDLLVVFGTRPEAIKLFPVIAALRERTALGVRICVTGQHRGMLDQVLNVAGIAPDTDLDLMRPGQSLARLTSCLVDGLSDVIAAERPRRVVVQGDTATAIAASFVAHRQRIPVSHVEAGLRSADLASPWPEEVNRRAISLLADQHFAPTQTAADALRSESIPHDRIHLTGNTVIDALLATAARIEREPGLASAVDPLLRRFAGRRILLATVHRRESRGAAMASIATALERLARRDDIALVLPLHPAPEVRQAFAALESAPNAAIIDPLDYPNFVRLLGASHIVLTDSGGIQEEAPALGKPVFVLRDTTERPEGVEAGTARLVGMATCQIVAETERLLDNPAAHARMAKAHSPYGDGRAAERIATLLEAKLNGG